MAAPFDNSVLNGLALFDAIAQEQYYDKALEHSFTSGKKTNMLFDFRKSAVTGDGETFQAKTGIGDSARVSRDPYSDFVTGRPFTAKNYKVRWNADDTSAGHDFSHIDTCVQIGLYDLKRAADGGNMLSLVDTIVGDNLKDVEHKMAMLRRMGQTAQMGTVNGTPKQDDSNFIADCASTPVAHARVQVDNCAAVWFRKNMYVDIYDSSDVLRWEKVLVNFINFADTDTNAGSACSIGLEFVTGTTTGATANLTALADNDKIYLSGAKNKGAISVEAWMTAPTSSSDTLFNRDRLSRDYQWMLPTRVVANSTAVKISRAHLNKAANARGFVNDDVDAALLACCNPLIADSLRNQFEEGAFFDINSDDSRAKRFANFGMIGLNYQHPALGLIKIVGDEFMKPTTLDMYTVGSWLRLHYGSPGLQMLPGPLNGFNRLPSAVAGAPLSKHFSKDGYIDFVDICEDPNKQVRITNVTP